MLRWSLSASDGYFGQPEKFKNMVNTDFENINHLQNLGHLLLTVPSMYMGTSCVCVYVLVYETIDFDSIFGGGIPTPGR